MSVAEKYNGGEIINFIYLFIKCDVGVKKMLIPGIATYRQVLPLWLKHKNESIII
jgi:hypothetical protein